MGLIGKLHIGGVCVFTAAVVAIGAWRMIHDAILERAADDAYRAAESRYEQCLNEKGLSRECLPLLDAADIAARYQVAIRMANLSGMSPDVWMTYTAKDYQRLGAILDGQY